MLKTLDLENVLVMDIETVPQFRSYHEMDTVQQALWCDKCKSLNRHEKEPLEPHDLYERAGIYAEFGKIVCISAGLFRKNGSGYYFRVTSFCDHEEPTLLEKFCQVLNRHYKNPRQHSLCAHNGREFDYPYIARRLLINKMSLPSLLDISGKKPWETNHLLDTMTMWSFGDRKSFTSLKLMAACFGIQSPKDDIDGSQVGSVYWNDGDLERITTYCQKDVVTTGRLLLHLAGQPDLQEDYITYA